MALTGGAVTVALARLQEELHGVSAFKRGICGGVLITGAELIVGLTVNRVFHMQVWDYSREAFNFQGQICLKYALLWSILAVPVMNVT